MMLPMAWTKVVVRKARPTGRKWVATFYEPAAAPAPKPKRGTGLRRAAWKRNVDAALAMRPPRDDA